MLNEKENGGTRKEKEKGQRAERVRQSVCVCMGACMCVERKISCGFMLVRDVRMGMREFVKVCGCVLERERKRKGQQ